MPVSESALAMVPYHRKHSVNSGWTAMLSQTSVWIEFCLEMRVVPIASDTLLCDWSSGLQVTPFVMTTF